MAWSSELRIWTRSKCLGGKHFDKSSTSRTCSCWLSCWLGTMTRAGRKSSSNSTVRCVWHVKVLDAHAWLMISTPPIRGKAEMRAVFRLAIGAKSCESLHCSSFLALHRSGAGTGCVRADRALDGPRRRIDLKREKLESLASVVLRNAPRNAKRTSLVPQNDKP